MSRAFGIVLLLGFIVAAVHYIDENPIEPMSAVSARESAPTHGYGPRSVTVQSDRRGHFLVDATVNGRSVQMLADTGASAVVLTEQDARRAGFDARALEFDIPVQTANGTTQTASVTLDTIEIEGIVVDDVRALVARSEDLGTSLLGMTFLGRLASVTMSDDRLELVE